MNAHAVPRRAEGWAALEIEGEVLVYDGEVLNLITGPAAQIWARIDGVRRAGEIAAEVAARYLEPSEKVTEDVLGLLRDLAEQGVVDQANRSDGPRYRRREHVGWTVDGDTTLLVDLDDGRRRQLSPTGGQVWALIGEHFGDVEPVLRSLANRYADAPPTLSGEVADLLDRLVAEQFLVRQED